MAARSSFGKSETGPLVASDPMEPVGASTEPDLDKDGFVAQPVIKRSKNGPFLVGASDIGTQRVISKADFASVGIVQETLTFDWQTGYKLPVAGINPKAVKYLVENEYGFSVSDE